MDPVTKAAFDFSDRELSLLVTKGIGDLTGLERAGGELVGWGTYSRLVAEVEDPELPDWQAGGPVLGNLLALSGSFAGSGGALVATPTMSPQGSRFPLSVSPPTLGGELVLAQRNSSAGDLESWVTLQGASKGSLQWAGDSLYHFVYGSEQGGTLSRWERAQFGQQELSVSPSWTLEVAGPTDVRGKSYRESFVIAPDESWAFVAMMTTDLEGTPARNAVWLDLTQEPPVVLAEAVLADGDTWFQNCIATKDQAACTGVDTYFYERVAEDGDQVVATTGQDNFDVPVVPFAMSGGWIYLASAGGLRRVPFGFSLADFAAAPLISMSFHPTAMAATSNAWAVASRNELVLFSPECAEQPEPTGLGGASGAD